MEKRLRIHNKALLGSLEKSLENAKKTALDYLNEYDQKNTNSLIEKIRKVMDDEMEIRLDAQPELRGYMDSILQFERFRYTYTWEELFIQADDSQPEPELPIQYKHARRLAGFAIHRANEGVGYINIVKKSDKINPKALQIIMLAALDAWQALHLCNLRAQKVKDKGQYREDGKSINKKKGEAASEAKKLKRLKFKEEIARLRDAYIEKRHGASTKVVAKAIYGMAIEYAEKIEYRFRGSDDTHHESIEKFIREINRERKNK